MQHRVDHHTIVIGGGQAGLVAGYELVQRGVDFVILDASERIGDAWRNRWDSLRLFTPAHMSGLPGMPFPASPNDFVGKDQVADFLEEYAITNRLPVRSGVRVIRLSSGQDGFELTTADGESMRARNVIVAMADYQQPYTPEFASSVSPDIYQVHSSRYQNASELNEGEVLVVGFGNSGSDIALEVSRTHPTVISGTPGPSIPFALESWFGVNIGTRLVKFVTTKVLSTSTPIGRKARPKAMESGKAPLVRVRPQELRRAGVRHVGRIVGVESGRPVTSDGEVMDVSNVIWCTGYRPGFSEWIDVPVLDVDGRPVHERGVTAVDGLYFLGLFFLHALWSETIPGVQQDARYIAEHLVEHRTAGERTMAS